MGVTRSVEWVQARDPQDDPEYTHRLVRPLFVAFPELEAPFHADVADWTPGTGGRYSLYPFFFNVFDVALRRVLAGEEPAERMDALFSWLEDLALLGRAEAARDGDRYLDFFLMTEVMEEIAKHPAGVELCRTRMGPACVQLFVESEAKQGITEHLPFP